MAALLGICTGATVSTDSTIAAADVPVVGLSTKKPYGVTAKRPTKASAATNTGNEDRGNAANLMQAGTSKLDDLVTSANLETFKFLVNNLQLGDDFVASLRSSQLKNLNTFHSSNRRTRDSEKHISLIAPLTAKYGDDAVAKALVKLERDTNTPPEMATLVQQLRSEQLTYWLQNGISGYDVFKLLNRVLIM
ncbi:hypothetical protein GN958_ATG17638 [Phytophthora infestans]|uniref:RxLR effector protein n=1 Tax=Phytophthora infestans TaxID=4787 RepID=A0A8S9U0B7_PHYIN|nr:hypothetical protein GN958_ATG17638 [Phytophthora infestans]